MLCWRYGLGERAVTAQHMRSLCPETPVRTHISSQLPLLLDKCSFLNSVKQFLVVEHLFPTGTGMMVQNGSPSRLFGLPLHLLSLLVLLALISPAGL